MEMFTNGVIVLTGKKISTRHRVFFGSNIVSITVEKINEDAMGVKYHDAIILQ